MAEKSNKLKFRCKCQRIHEAEWRRALKWGNLLHKGWIAEECPAHEKTDLSHIEVVSCPHCEQLQIKGNETCISCGLSMRVHVGNIAISCPECNTAIYIPNEHKGSYTCKICEYEIDEKLILSEKAKQNVALEKPMLINLKNASEMQAKDLVIYKHPINEFPFKSQLQVSEGTYALLLQNGVCQYPCNPGLHVLEKSNLKSEQRFDAAMSEGNVVFRTDIYGVLKNLPALNWGGFGRFKGCISGHKAAFVLRGNGKLSLQVSDAKAFADYVGYREVTWSKLTEYNASTEVPDGKLKQLINSLMKEAFSTVCKTLSDEQIETDVLASRKSDIVKQLQSELNKQFVSRGLVVLDIAIGDLNAEETEESRNLRMQIEQQQHSVMRLLDKAQTEINWKLQNVQLHQKGDFRLQAFFDFVGTCRLQVQDREALFAVPEVRELLAPNAVVQDSAFFANKITALTNNHLGIIAQEYIDSGRIERFLDQNAYKVLLEDVQAALNADLAGMGLRLQNFGLSVNAINQSSALKAHLKMPENKQKIRQYIENYLELKSEPIKVHMRDDMTVYVKVEYTGSVYLRVTDENAFFKTSEVQEFIHSEPLVSQQVVRDFYTKRFNGLFTTILSGIVQAVVNDTNANIQELYLINNVLMQNLGSNLQQRAADLGLSLSSLDLKQPREIEQSSNLRKYMQMHETRSDLALQQEIDRMQNNHTIFKVSEDNRVEIVKSEAKNEIYAHENDMKAGRLVSDSKLDDLNESILQKKSDREHQKKMDELKKNAELQSMVDQMAADKKERNYHELQKDKQREYTLAAEEIKQQNYQSQLRQQGQIDTAARDQQAEFAKKLNEAENKRLLNDILRKIDESDLDWKTKLDEYARLSRALNVKNDVELDGIKAKSKAEIDTLGSQTAENIKLQQDATHYTIGQTKIKLNAAEAELLERVAKWAEERQARQESAQEERAVRKTVLKFEQRMQDRREQVAQEMEKLTLQYQQTLAIRDRDDKLAQMEYESKRLQYILDHLTREISEKASVEKARFHAQEEIEKAKAQYDKEYRDAKIKADQERLARQMEQEEKLAQRADEFKKEMARLENERNRDDKNAEVAIAQAQTNKTVQNIERTLDKIDDRYHDLCKKMDEIGKGYIQLKERVRGIERTSSAGSGGQPGVSAPPPGGWGWTPPSGGWTPPSGGWTPPSGGWTPPPSGWTPPAGSGSPATAQPGMAQKTCPRCGRVYSIYSTFCDDCKMSI